jgi:hypothetical protein
MAFSTHVKAQSANIYISSDGAVVGTNNIQHNGNLYVLTGNISGSIAVQKSNITIDGSGYTLRGNGGTGIDLTNNVTDVPSSREIWNVTIENLAIMNFNYSITTNGGGNDTLYNDYIANTVTGLRGGIFLWGCQGNNITHCGITGQPAIFFDFCSSSNNVTKNNLSGGIWLELGGDETVDSNYWSDYLTKYPNATEVDSSEAWNIPYQFTTYGTAVGGILQDNHPLMKPTTILLTASNPKSTIPEVPTFIAVAIVLIATTTGIFFYKKKRMSYSQ